MRSPFILASGSFRFIWIRICAPRLRAAAGAEKSSLDSPVGHGKPSMTSLASPSRWSPSGRNTASCTDGVQKLVDPDPKNPNPPAKTAPVKQRESPL